MPGPGKKFEKGKAGGPGRPKVPSEFKEKCKAFTDSTIFEKWTAEVEAKGEHWVKCSELLSAYGHGKPTQAITGEDGGALEVIVRTVTDEG